MIAEVGYKEDVYDENIQIPEEFDARDIWIHCNSVYTIWNQGSCGSCWAVASASVMSDRYCIRNETNVMLSAYDVMSCCKNCYPSGPCNGGYPIKAFEHWNTVGVVTGGPKSCAGCTCYRYSGDNLFKCDHKCRAGFRRSYDSEITHGRPAKYLKNDVEAIQLEIMFNGPVVATFAVYSDFGSQGRGVYIHRSGTFKGYHAVRVIGWGVHRYWDKLTPYWLVANSWGSNWGDGGYFRILRGSNHCGIEGSMVAD
ncbi:unnamed protein product [Calicophoron daubneyi]|uniref:Peptidase C1A papain C-terminal domain-containing protein n=1 Tax=Calicophoron daubneyi TaxID=300641 RepID=A0AAV2TU53_CALDB